MSQQPKFTPKELEIAFLMEQIGQTKRYATGSKVYVKYYIIEIH